MRLSSDDLPMFFEPAHIALAARLRDAAPAIAEVEEGAAHIASQGASGEGAGAHGAGGEQDSAGGQDGAGGQGGAGGHGGAGGYVVSTERGGLEPARAGGNRPSVPHFDQVALATSRARLRAAAAASAAVEEGGLGVEAARDVAAVKALAKGGLFELVAPESGKVDARSLCLAREMLGYVSARADSIFAVQGLGVHPLLLAGSDVQRALIGAYTRGVQVAAFALTEPEAGSDVASIQTRATAIDGGYRLDGDKLFISNLGIADHATVFATTDPALGSAGLTAFWVPLNADGVTVKPMAATAPHPIGALELRGAVVHESARIGAVGQGMKLAMQTLDAFRVSVGAAAVGMARRAMDEALAFVTRRVQFGKPLAEQQLVQAHLADMAVDLDAARLLVLRAAHRKDTVEGRVTTEVSIAKLGATEAAQRVIDRAVQLFGGRGVMHGHVVEHLYRAIRPLRIYEGTSEIQRTIIGRALAKEALA